MRGDLAILALIARRVHPSRRHLIDNPDADLSADLGLCHIDLISIACDIEEECGFMFEGDPELAWETVADVLRAVEDMQ